MTAQPALFLPGLNNDAHVWDGTVDALSGDLECRSIDLPALSSLSGIVDEILDDVRPGTIVVGHSFGGAVALELADRHPHLVAGLVLVNTPTGADDPEAARLRRQRATEARDGAFETMAMAATEAVFYGTAAQDARVRAERLRGIRAYGPERYYAHSLALIDRPNRSTWKPAGVPVLVVAAENDEVVPTVEQRAFAHRHSYAYVEIPKTGHMLPMEAPDELAAAISGWRAHDLTPRTDGDPHAEQSRHD